MSGASKTIIITTLPSKANVNGLGSSYAIRRALPPVTTAQNGMMRTVARPAFAAHPVPAQTQQQQFLERKRIAADWPLASVMPPRKRERLVHLTPEEKQFRRKMKNRIAAQTARDRKKLKMIDLETGLKRLEQENKTLMRENARLRQRTNNLSEENERLKKQLENTDTITTPVQQLKQEPLDEHQQRLETTGVALGSAASINGPLPWEQANNQWSTTSSSSLATLILTFLSWICKQSSGTCCKTPNSSSVQHLMSHLTSSKENSQPELAVEQLKRLLVQWKATRKKVA